MTAAEFRIYCRIARRMGNRTGYCSESTLNMAEACHLKPKTVAKILDSLVEKGLAFEQPKLGRSTIYRILSPENISSTPPPNGARGPKRGDTPPKRGRETHPPKGGDTPPKGGPPKVPLLKVPPLKVRSEGGESPARAEGKEPEPNNAEPSLNEEVCRQIEVELSLEEGFLRQMENDGAEQRCKVLNGLREVLGKKTYENNLQLWMDRCDEDLLQVERLIARMRERALSGNIKSRGGFAEHIWKNPDKGL